MKHALSYQQTSGKGSSALWEKPAMISTLRVMQVLLAIFFLYGGLVKLVPPDSLPGARLLVWLLSPLPKPLVYFTGITEMLGFQPLSDEWKVMGLASYGNPTVDLSRLIRCGEDTYWVDGRRFYGRTDFDRAGLEEVVGRRREGDELTERHQDLARSAQGACEQAMLALLRRVTRLTGCRRLCLAGGVALNCKANGDRKSVV